MPRFTFLFAITALLFSAYAISGPTSKKVCVRNYGEVKGGVCDRFPENYAFVAPATDFEIDEEPVTDATRVCTRIYSDSYCDSTPEYVHVDTMDGRTICVLDNDQPKVVNLCAKTPQYYDYVSRK